MGRFLPPTSFSETQLPDPHPLSNDLTHEPLQPSPASRHAPPRLPIRKRELSTRGMSRMVRRTLIIVGGIALAAAVVAAVLFPRPELMLIGALLLVAYAVVLIAPVLLADMTKEAQDEAVRPSPPPSDDTAGTTQV